MRRFLIAFLLLTFASPSLAQDVSTPQITDLADLPQILNFETQATEPIAGWKASPKETIFADNAIVHSGRWAVRLERNSDSPGTFSTLHRAVAMSFAGRTVEIRGFLRTENVSEMAGLWLRIEGDGNKRLAFDNMARHQLNGTTGWTQYSVTLPSLDEGKLLVFGVLLVGTGKVWADDLELRVDGKPVWQAPSRPLDILQTDKRFDTGSHQTFTALSAVQIDNLTTLGKVWGFLKYHHPAVTSGKFHWDYELLHFLPAIVKAPDGSTANAAMLHWLDALGPVAKCKKCATLASADLQQRPDLQWLADRSLLGKTLSDRLRSIYRARNADGRQFYIALPGREEIQSFVHELYYPNLKFPDPGFQLLAAYRFWNIVEYWSPNRDIIGEDWTNVLREFIPRLALAPSAEDYQRQLIAFIGRLHDSHATLSVTTARPPVGPCRFPFTLRFIESVPVITKMADSTAANSGLQIGDEIAALDGTPVAELVETWSPYYQGSNKATFLRDVAKSMGGGDCGEAWLRIRRGNDDLELKVQRVPRADYVERYAHDLPGDTFRMLSNDIAYLKLSSVKAKDVAHDVELAAGAKGLIVDIRNYPSDPIMYALGELLVDRRTPFVRYSKADLANPGAFRWMAPFVLEPKQPHFAGQVVILVDELSQSQSEFTTMAFRTAPGAVVVGSTTAGADGDITGFALPGGLSTQISGPGVFYPDKRPTQRIGIVPDIEARPTIAGIRAGRDEVLEAGIREVLGPEAPADEVQRLARPQPLD